MNAWKPKSAWKPAFSRKARLPEVEAEAGSQPNPGLKPPFFGWVGFCLPPCLTLELIGEARNVGEESKALEGGILMQPYNFLRRVKCLVKVRPQVIADSFRLTDC